MSEITLKCLDVFPTWLADLGETVRTVATVADTGIANDDARRPLLGGLNYLFKSLDLVPDGIDDIGWLDDAFVLRVAARVSCETGGLGPEADASLRRFAEEARLVEELLGAELFGRFARYVKELGQGAARGRSVDELIQKPEVRRELMDDVQAFVKEFTAPSFSKDEKNLVKLKSFFEAKLPK